GATPVNDPGLGDPPERRSDPAAVAAPSPYRGMRFTLNVQTTKDHGDWGRFIYEENVDVYVSCARAQFKPLIDALLHLADLPAEIPRAASGPKKSVGGLTAALSEIGGEPIQARQVLMRED